ncbi:MAG: hypothetical protein JXO22_15145 [Phycisphaerae bacterium]|nr:hypothetical protein [Phycisphaerae bacterium]
MMKYTAPLIAAWALGTAAVAQATIARPVASPATVITVRASGRDAALHTARGRLRAARAAELVARRDAVVALAARQRSFDPCVRTSRIGPGVTVTRVNAVVRNARVVHRIQTPAAVEVKVRVPASGVTPTRVRPQRDLPCHGRH